MEDLRHRRTQEEMDSIPTTEEKYAVMINDTIKSLFIKDDMEHEVKHDINLEEFSNPENFNKFFCGGLLALYKLYTELVDANNITVLDFHYLLLQMAVNMNIELAQKEAIEQYRKEHEEKAKEK